MIYTIGHTESYHRYFEEQGTPSKKGRTEDYSGGSVWKTIEDAEKHCPKGYSVFGMIADWDKDTEPSKDGDWNDLLIDADLVKLESGDKCEAKCKNS